MRYYYIALYCIKNIKMQQTQQHYRPLAPRRHDDSIETEGSPPASGKVPGAVGTPAHTLGIVGLDWAEQKPFGRQQDEGWCKESGGRSSSIELAARGPGFKTILGGRPCAFDIDVTARPSIRWPSHSCETSAKPGNGEEHQGGKGMRSRRSSAKGQIEETMRTYRNWLASRGVAASGDWRSGGFVRDAERTFAQRQRG